MRGARLRGRKACLAALGLALSATACGAVATADPLSALARRHGVESRHLSVLVQAVDETRPRFALNPLAPRNPASTIKLVTTAVSLDVLGPTYQWQTAAWATGPIRNGVLEGDLLLEGRGDPWLIEEEFWRFLGEIRAAGIEEIRGQLLIDDTYFAPLPRTAGDFDGQPWRLYNVMPNALLVNFKAVTLVFRPEAGRIAIGTLPSLPGLRIDNRLRAVEGRCRGIAGAVRISVPDPAHADHLVIEGDYPRSCGTQQLPRSFMSPATYAHALFIRLWQQWGGRFSGGVRRSARPPHARRLTTHYSPPLGELIRPLNKWSNNVMADAMFLTLAGGAAPPPLQPGAAEARVRAWLATHAIPHEGFAMENGSGLSRTTRISALTLQGVLHQAWRSRWMPEYLASLSIAGVDGTLRKRLRGGEEAGWMHLKSGHLNGVSAVAGFVRARSGRTFVVVFFLNGPGGAGHALGDALLRWTYRQ